MTRQWEEVAAQFRERFNPSQGSMGRWEQAETAYRYGWEAAQLSTFAGQSWAAAAAELERGWPAYQRVAGRGVVTEWEGYKKAVQESYERAAATVAAPAQPAPVDPTRIVRDFLDAYNSKGKASLDTILGSFAPDAEVSFSPLAGSVAGEQNLRAAFTGAFADEAGTQLQVTTVTGGPDLIAAEWVERGRNYRTAEDVLRHVAGFFEMRDGKIGRVRMYTVRVR
ncbi:MAG: nuclear transport factor 2 family protein [Chloroflexi bacterium]|nr:nuclear transport factor 2 family protein [Chloroflexota bacterium]